MVELSSLHQETGHVSNLSVVCGDGVLASHKIVLAGVSTFIKSIIAAIPVGDHITVIMPDFCVDEMEEFLQMIISENVSDNFPLCSAFGQPVMVSSRCDIGIALSFSYFNIVLRSRSLQGKNQAVFR